MSSSPAHRKTEELFARWLALPETMSRVQRELALLKSGKWDANEATLRREQSHTAAEALVLPSPPASSTASPATPRPTSASRRRSPSGAAPPPSPPPIAPSVAEAPTDTADAPTIGLATLTLELSTAGAPQRDLTPRSSPQTARRLDSGATRMPVGAYSAAIPRFHGSVAPAADMRAQVAAQLKSTATKGRLTVLQCERAAVHMGLSRFCALAVALRSGLDPKKQSCPLANVLALWEKLATTADDPIARLVFLCGNGQAALAPDDLHPLVDYVVQVHPGLAFLLDRPEFHERYVQTVIQRLFFEANRSWSGKLTVAELRRSSFLASLTNLDTPPLDINQNRDLFSYEHFYVIYTTFWKLDSDHDLIINRAELARYNDDSLSEMIVDRIFANTVLRAVSPPGKMSYNDFVWFILANEDKNHPTSIEFWFRCMDLDGDGVISLYEMAVFYEDQAPRLQDLGVETLSFSDTVCLVLDMVRPKQKDFVTLGDLRRCGQAAQFFNTFFDVNKVRLVFLDAEEKDPFAALREKKAEGSVPFTDWVRFANVAYQRLSQEDDEEVADRSDHSDDPSDDPSEHDIVDYVDNGINRLVF